MDTEAIATEIVQLKNRIAELDGDENAEERRRLHERLRVLQDRLTGKSSKERDPESPGNEVQYVPPV